ncbi:glycosyltransferase [Alteromonas sp. 345S023]|uniref:Glycosyltransferase n=1 Tax=Alteromonas profundi TaxID=2696062 RepID=A0A7X5LIC7_9ALTE|nr:glycosyltransferase [Alteromonas profundi]NDV89858.1 glycosyltransferase [Alteromonas profundi]
MIMNGRPFLSYVLPTRDRPQLLKKCLQYLDAQEGDDYEVIVSDNSIIKPCKDVVSQFLNDNKFKYFRPAEPLSMPDNWEFAIEKAQGQYITVINEKFLFHPRATGVLHALANEFSTPDILSWQYEHFAMSDGEGQRGTYHPLIKPVMPSVYSALQELKRRFDFIDPLFGRSTQEKISFGKIYSGAVNRKIVEKIKQYYGRVFVPMSPDFTSMVCALNFSDVCLEVGRSLMMVVSGENISNGESTKVSLPAAKRFLKETTTNFSQYISQLVVPGFWLGHNIFIASDYARIKAKYSTGNLSNVKLNIAAALGWAMIDYEQVTDWGNEDPAHFKKILDDFYVLLTGEEQAITDSIIEQNEKTRQPSPREIYHSGLTKSDTYIPNISPEELAHYHWEKQLALPRKPVSTNPQHLDDAMDFYIRYTNRSVQLLGL